MLDVYSAGNDDRATVRQRTTCSLPRLSYRDLRKNAPIQLTGRGTTDGLSEAPAEWVRGDRRPGQDTIRLSRSTTNDGPSGYYATAPTR